MVDTASKEKHIIDIESVRNSDSRFDISSLQEINDFNDASGKKNDHLVEDTINEHDKEDHGGAKVP